MELLIFENKNWSEIPKDDNPTWIYRDNGLRKQECVIVSKVLPYEAKTVTDKGFSVVHIPLEGEIIRKGLFWNIEDATLFAEVLCNKDALSFK